MRRALIISLLFTFITVQAQDRQRVFTAAWWNVENLFDTRDDPNTNDDDYTPEGENHWTRKKLERKVQGLAKTIVMMDLPDVVGMAEVENDYVLRELCFGTPLAQAGYTFVHHESPDHRGIDCALIYRKDRFDVTDHRTVSLSDSAAGFFTRDILVVEGVSADGDSVCLLMNHWPSKRGGDEAENHRMKAAQTLRKLMVELKEKHPTAAIVAMGDMNTTADEEEMTEGMGFGDDSMNADGIRNLTLRLPDEWGSHKYQGMWGYLDQMFLLADGSWMVGDLKVMRFEHLLTDDRGKMGVRPKRTISGTKYVGGLSDHLPLRLRLKRGDW